MLSVLLSHLAEKHNLHGKDLKDRSVPSVSSQSFQGRMIQIPAINRFLQPGSKRKPPPDENYAKAIMEVSQSELPSQ
ncbi:glutathione S-transferase alpha-4-like [Simochromis diagramma]|uniref:glutathione S-transferase alpha-4-like n=1 Tax=Simochromis diagramma TaxID=43689 RepID=UPI001A7E3768|nr:glutathione S-transferase alpha-4-like [Simochromis diagramma]